MVPHPKLPGFSLHHPRTPSPGGTGEPMERSKASASPDGGSRREAGAAQAATQAPLLGKVCLRPLLPASYTPANGRSQAKKRSGEGT